VLQNLEEKRQVISAASNSHKRAMLTYGAKLAFTDSIAIHDDPVGLETCCLVEQDQQFPTQQIRIRNLV